jgi:hypothetical protein
LAGWDDIAIVGNKNTEGEGGMSETRKCPECGANPWQARDYENVVAANHRFQRSLEKSAIEAAKQTVRIMELEEKEKLRQSKVNRQRLVIVRMEKRLRDLGKRPYGEDREPALLPIQTTRGVDLIRIERLRQISDEGYDSWHDRELHPNGELVEAAISYALQPFGLERADEAVPALWPWNKSDWKPSPADRIRELVKAGALIAAEIDRLDRKSLPDDGSWTGAVQTLTYSPGENVAKREE